MVKSIIKRIIVGVGIALCLMYIKGNLLLSVNAKSCEEVSKYTYKALENNVNEAVGNTTNLDVNYLSKPMLGGSISIPFRGSDFFEVRVPLTYIFAIYQNNTIIDNPNSNTFSTTEYSYLSQQQPLVYLVDNTNNPSGGYWTQGWSDGSYYHFRYFKKDYQVDYVNFISLKFGVPNTPILSAQVTAWVSINNYFPVYYYDCDSNEELQDAINDNTQATEDINNTINDNTTDDPSSDISSMNSKLASNNSITQLLTLPIQMYQNILNSVNGSCSSFSLGSLYGHNLTLPCINLQSLLGSTLYGIIDILISGLFILSFRKKMVDIFNNMTSLKDRGNELE